MNKKILAIDYGNTRIGTAISDPNLKVATPYRLLRHTPDIMQRIIDILRLENISTIIFGNPTDIHGENTKMSNTILEFSNKLRGILKEEKINVDIIFWDEALTSHQAYDNLLEKGETHKKIKNKIDMESARIILQEYLDQL